MEYRKKLNYYGPIETEHITGYERKRVTLEVGKYYKIVHVKPTRKKDRNNNGRDVEILGFTDAYGDVIVRYIDNNRRGRVHVNCLLPIDQK